MKKRYYVTKRAVSVLIILAMMLSVLSCSKSGYGDGSTDANPEAAQAQETAEETVDEVPEEVNVYEGLDFKDSDMRILYFTHDSYGPYDAVGDNSGDVLFDAVYNRNLAVEEKAHIKLNWIPGSNDYNGHPQMIVNSITAGTDDFDTAFLTAQYAFTNMMGGYFLDIGHTKYIDIEDPWWYTDFMKETCITPERYYFVNGAFSLSTLLKSGAIYFNKEIAKNHFQTDSLFYDDVRAGKWTLDKMTEYSRTVTSDTNGNGIMDENDMYGFINDGQATTNYLSTSCGLEFSGRDGDGIPFFDLYNERVLDLVDKLYVLSTDNTVMKLADDKINGLSGFVNGQSLFYFKFLVTTSSVRDSDFAWGILPYPVLYEGTEYSCAGSSVNGDAAVLPNTVSADKSDMCSAVLNALSWESYKNVIPVCLESSLKSKYADSPADREMVEIIYDSISTPFIMVGSGFLDGIGSIFTSTVLEQKLDAGGYTSYWASNKERYEVKLAEMLETYRQLIESGK